MQELRFILDKNSKFPLKILKMNVYKVHVDEQSIKVCFLKLYPQNSKFNKDIPEILYNFPFLLHDFR